MTDLMNHETFPMPALVTQVPLNLHKFFQNGSVAADALGSTTSRIMIVTIYVILVLVIRVLGAK
jgi:hypothetical protein